jgi:GMP reductase
MTELCFNLMFLKHQLFTAIDKHQTVEDWKKFAVENPDLLKQVAVSSGISEQDAVRLKEVINALPEINFICLDVANGYTESFVQFVKSVRKDFPTKTIIV